MWEGWMPAMGEMGGDGIRGQRWTKEDMTKVMLEDLQGLGLSRGC